jgi:hypothetical protein
MGDFNDSESTQTGNGNDDITNQTSDYNMSWTQTVIRMRLLLVKMVTLYVKYYSNGDKTMRELVQENDSNRVLNSNGEQ